MRSTPTRQATLVGLFVCAACTHISFAPTRALPQRPAKPAAAVKVFYRDEAPDCENTSYGVVNAQRNDTEIVSLMADLRAAVGRSGADGLKNVRCSVDAAVTRGHGIQATQVCQAEVYFCN